MRYTYEQPEYLDRVGVIHLVQQLKVYIDGIATGNIDLSDYVTKTELQAKLDALNIDIDLSAYATKEELTNALRNIDLSSYATKEYVTDAINNAQLGGDGSGVDLSIYAKKSDLESKAEIEHTHTMSDITDYTAPDLSSYAKKTDIPSLTGYATKSYVDQNKFSGSYNDLTNKPTIPSIDGLATTEYVDNAVSNIPTGECVIKGREKDITSTFISPRTVTECELPALPTFEGGTKLYAQTSVLPNSKNFIATIRDKNGNLILDNYVSNVHEYVTLSDTTEGYLDDYIFYGMDFTIGENNPTTISKSYFLGMVIGRAKDYDSETQTYLKYEYIDVTHFTNGEMNELISTLDNQGDEYWSPVYYNGQGGLIGEIENAVTYDVSEVQGKMNIRMQGIWAFNIWIFVDDVFYKKIDGNNVTKTIDVSNASNLTIVFRTNGADSTDTIENSVFWSYPTYKNITLNFYTESLDGTQKSDIHTLEFGEGKTMPLTDFDKNKILRYSSDSIIQYIDEPLVDYVSEKIYTKTEVNKLMSGYATENYVDEKVAEIPTTDLSNYYTKSETDALIPTVTNGVDGKDGQDGQDGQDGRGIRSTKFLYGYSSTPNTVPTSWSEIDSDLLVGKYRWVKVEITYSDNTTETNYISYVYSGKDGVDGTNGTDGTDGTNGVDGVTPHIDETTKHWFIGDTDTGILAEGTNGTNGTNGVDGQNGTDGYTPVRGTDYWTQEDINTIKAYIDTELGVIENGSY